MDQLVEDVAIDSLEFQAFKKLPKVELHAHLNGSISQNTVRKLIKLKKMKTGLQSIAIPSETQSTISGVFGLFSFFHELTDNLEALYLATCDIIQEFYEDGVYYLELRTTPKETDNYTREEYMDTVLKAIEDTCSKCCQSMIVKILMSIDRKRSLEAAEETFKIFEKYVSKSCVIGIDLSGDPRCHVQNIYPVLQHAKKSGHKLAVHISEVPNMYEEVYALLKLRPDRLGHGTFLHPKKGGSVENFKLLNELKIPLECCLTSNVITQTVDSYENHHFSLFRDINYPCTLCTDDKGVFSTSLSKEYYLASKYYGLTKKELFNLSYDSINYILSSDEEKEKLQKLWKKYDEIL